MVKIDCHNGWFKGLGDIVCFAWIGQAMIAAGHEIEFFAQGWRADVLRMFQMPVSDLEAGAITTHHGYEEAIEQGSQLSYVEWIAHHHGISLSQRAIRPRANIMPMDREMGRTAAADVLVFPGGVWSPRVWPKAYYVDIVDRLKTAGINVKVVLEAIDGDFHFVHCIEGKSLPFVSAAIQKARLVIGNDSGPALLAGTLGTRTIAIHGPTTERIYAHIPEVTSCRKVSIGCAGCHCLPNKADHFSGWRKACQIGCGELYRTYPEAVYAMAMQALGRQEREAA